MPNSSPKRSLRNFSNASLCGSSSSSPRYRRLSSTLSIGTPNRSAERALPVEMLGDVEFAGGLAQAGDHQNQRRQRPGNVLLPRRQHPLQELVQPQLLDQFQRQPHSAELPSVLDPHPSAVDFDVARLGLRFHKQTPLARLIVRQGGFLHAQPAGFVDLTEVGHGPLPRPARGAIGLNEPPIGLTPALLPHIRGAKKHVAMLPPHPRLPSRKVCTTQTLAAASPPR